MRVVLGHGASGDAASMKPYVVGFKRRGIDAIAVDLPRGGAEKAVPVFMKTSGRGREVVGGGQSFGGMVASTAAIEADFGGLVLFSYPLHRPGFPDQLRTEHWPQIRCPTLFLSGDRDPFARIDLLKEKIKLIPDARLEVFKGQGHGLLAALEDRKSTRLNSSHRQNPYTVLCLKKKTPNAVVSATDSLSAHLYVP